MSTPKDLKKIFLDRIKDIPYKMETDRHLRKMKTRLHEELDVVWLRYNNKEATYQEWEKALDKLIKAEKL